MSPAETIPSLRRLLAAIDAVTAHGLCACVGTRTGDGYVTFESAIDLLARERATLYALFGEDFLKEVERAATSDRQPPSHDERAVLQSTINILTELVKEIQSDRDTLRARLDRVERMLAKRVTP